MKSEMKEDPRRIYFRLLHLLSVAVPNTEKLLEEFKVSKDIPEVTRRLMIEAIDSSMKKLNVTMQRLAELKRKLSESEEGGKQ